MERSAKPSRRKHELSPISLDEALADSALTGMLSFLSHPTTGEPLPWANINTSTVEYSSTVETSCGPGIARSW